MATQIPVLVNQPVEGIGVLHPPHSSSAANNNNNKQTTYLLQHFCVICWHTTIINHLQKKCVTKCVTRAHIVVVVIMMTKPLSSTFL